jgi:DNA mismatch repair protein MutS2
MSDLSRTASRALEPLEWIRFLDLSLAEARTDRAKGILFDLRNPENWAQNVANARVLQQETQEVSQLLDRDALWGPLTELADPSDAIERLKRGSVMEVVELSLLRRWLYAVDSWVQVPRDEIRGELFKKALHQLPDPLQPIQVLDKILTPEGELSERASPRLASLYQEIRSLRREISIVLDQLLKTLSSKGVLQENFTDVRDGRYVVPVKISNQGDVDGIIYEASASRQTVFVEPREVAHLNNRLRQRQNELVQEIYIVLDETSKKIRPFANEIDLAVSILSHWDAVQARSRFGRHYGGKAIHVTEERVFVLHQTAHPLLWWSMKPEEIIRNEIDFGDPVRTLLLTGPNTGGKTVLLKTLGLAGVCARTGFPFPGTDHPTVPFFDSFFADLGDPQSIEQHLSSFSGHILRFKEILSGLTDQSLILVDELNSATDPEEGAAIGRAFLETIMSRGAMTVTTTHDPHLKAMAGSDERILNASMAFDESSRTPTYKMLIGVPGRSRALETAERLGLPMSVIDLARSYLSKEHVEFEKLLSKLESDSREADKARKEAERMREEAERMREEWTKRTETSVNEMMDRTRQKLRRILEQAQDEVRTSVKKIDEIKSRREFEQARQNLSEASEIATSRLESALEEEAPEIAEALHKQKKEKQKEQEKPKGLEVGQIVRIPKWKNTGTLLEVSGNKVKVAMGSLQMSLSKNDIEPLMASEIAAVKHAQAKNQPKRSKFNIAGLHDVPVPPETIDLRGKRLDDAMSELEHYIDQAYRSGGRVQVTIVHGLGTGAIREGARALLAKLPYVKDYRDAGAGHGGTGATLVEFDRD